MVILTFTLTTHYITNFPTMAIFLSWKAATYHHMNRGDCNYWLSAESDEDSLWTTRGWKWISKSSSHLYFPSRVWIHVCNVLNSICAFVGNIMNAMITHLGSHMFKLQTWIVIDAVKNNIIKNGMYWWYWIVCIGDCRVGGAQPALAANADIAF